jgi:hypothetical protein
MNAQSGLASRLNSTCCVRLLNLLAIVSCSASAAPSSAAKRPTAAKSSDHGAQSPRSDSPGASVGSDRDPDAAPMRAPSETAADGGSGNKSRSDASTPRSRAEPVAPPPDTRVSAWTHGVGAVLDDDSSVFCIVRTSGAHSGHLESSFRRVPSDPDVAAVEPYVFASARLRARLTCSERPHGAGKSVVVMTADSQDADHDTVSADCPDALPYGADPQCQIEGHDDAHADAVVALRLIYLPSDSDTDDVPHASGSTCIASITEAKPKGQLTGFDPEWMTPSGQVTRTLPLFNEALMRAAAVGGTDEGAIFLAQGKLYFSFGDTSDLDTNDPVTMALDPPPGWRSNVLAHTSDFDARDGIALDGFEMGSGSQAQENVKSPHQTQENPGDEFTAIPLAGFGLTSGDGHRYRFLWFVSVHKWFDLIIPDFEANYSSLAYSVDESADWTRLPSPPSPPAATFGPGTVWFDRYNRFLYFFGITPDHGAVRLARVRSAFSKVIDPDQYQYWNGTSWAANDLGSAAELIPSTDQHSPRSEMSVAFNPAADVFMMMLVNWYSSPTVDTSNQVELWQAPAVTGPWTKIDADAQLPNGNAVLTYGPMMSEHLLIDGGVEVPVLLSQMYPIYNVHLYSYRINVAQKGCSR